MHGSCFGCLLRMFNSRSCTHAWMVFTSNVPVCMCGVLQMRERCQHVMRKCGVKLSWWCIILCFLSCKMSPAHYRKLHFVFCPSHKLLSCIEAQPCGCGAALSKVCRFCTGDLEDFIIPRVFGIWIHTCSSLCPYLVATWPGIRAQT